MGLWASSLIPLDFVSLCVKWKFYKYHLKDILKIKGIIHGEYLASFLVYCGK